MGNGYCLIRKSAIVFTPEEVVRQKVLYLMTATLGYPASGFVIEQSLHSMPHLQTVPKKHFPNRRADILFFAKNIHPKHALYPLILIECKAIKLNPAAMNQVLSYNYFLQAYLVAIANEKEIKLSIRQPDGQYFFLSEIPTYSSLQSKFRM